MTRLTHIGLAAAPKAWDAAGFSLTADSFTVGGVTLTCGIAGPDDGSAISRWGFDVVPEGVDALDGLITVNSPAVAPAHTHPNGVVSLDHIVVGTSDVARTVSEFERVGLTPRRTEDGVRGDRATRYTFFLAGTAVIELIGPVEPRSQRPARFWGLAFTSADLDATAAALGPLATAPKVAIQPGRRIVTVDHAALGLGVPVAILSARVAD